VARAAGADVTTVPLSPAGWTLDVDRVRDALTPRTRAIVINFPHSPTGALIDRAQLDALVAMAEEHGAWLFSDEVYRGLEYDAATRLPAAADLSARALSLGVMSKAYGLAGLRIGWVAVQDAGLRQRMAALKDYTTICSSAPSEVLSLVALRARTQVVARSLRIIRDNLPVLDAFVQRHADRIAWVPPRAGSVAFPRLVREDSETFAEALLLPGSLFDVRGGHFRVGLGRRDMPEALGAMEAFMARHPRAAA
jgi:aspartate/methionine/tyrosine aminotransferase